MATSSKIAESSFRIGCGRYIQQSGAVGLLGAEILRLRCKRPFLLGGKTAFALTQESIRSSLSAAGLSGVFHTYTGFCCKETCAEILRRPDFQECDIVVGVGGGNLMDAAKYCAAAAGLPVINIPTSSATCAAYTPLSVCYTREGQTVGSVHHQNEVNAVLADMEILCRQPVRLVVAGIYDSLAKLYESNQRLQGIDPDEVDIGLLSSYQLSRFLYDSLNRKRDACLSDIAAGRNTKVVYDVMYMTIALTGVVSGLARGSNQTAVGHKIYEASRKLFLGEVRSFLHGEIVAVGLIAQILYNGGTADDAAAFAADLSAFGMPTSLRQLGVPANEETVRKYHNFLLASSAMKGTTEAEQARLLDCLRKIL